MAKIFWKSDGTEAGTVSVKDINPNGSGLQSALMNVNGVIFFAATDGIHGVELWKSDGTEAGTTIVADINPNGDSNPKEFTIVSDTLFFLADDGVNGYELFAVQNVSPPTISGDLDNSKTIDLTDAVLALQVIAGLNPDGVDLNADVDGDGRIGTEEAVYILQLVSGVRNTPNAALPTELWEIVADGGQGDGQWTIYKNIDDSVTTDGEFNSNYSGLDVHCPFAEGPVTVSGDSFSFAATGTATADGTPPGYESSDFTLNVSGTTSSGTANGTYTINFSTFGWPPSLSGTWTGTRTSGDGITQ